METRANYLLIGAFTLAGLIGAFAFLLWLAAVDVNRQFSYYDVLFENVSGLNTAGDVRYNGLPVGSVVAMDLDQDDPSQVRVRIEVAADTPIKTDTIAKLESQGVTGVSYVALSGGSAESERMPDGGVIESERSALQSLFEGAPAVLDQALVLLEDINKVVSEENRAAVTELLDNLASASGRLDQVLTDFEGLSADLGGAAREIANFTGTLENLSATAEVTLNTATETLESAQVATETAVGTLESARSAFDTADGLMQNELTDFVQQGTTAAETVGRLASQIEPAAVETLAAAQDLIETRLPELVEQVRAAASTLDTQVANLGGEASELMGRYQEVGTELQARLVQSEGAIEAFETATREATTTLESVRQTSDTATELLETDIRPLARDAAETVATARSIAEERLPPLIDQATETLATLDRESQALSSTAREALDLASQRLTQAQGTLAAFESAMINADTMITSVTNTSDEIYDLTVGDATALIADAQEATTDLRAAIGTINDTVQANLPAVMEEIRRAAESATGVIDSVGRNVTSLSGRLEGLAGQGETTLAAATETFATANETLTAITSAMDTAEGTLTSAQSTFDSVNQVIDEDIDAIVADVRGAVDVFSTTVAAIAEDVDSVSGEILSASQSASSLVGTVNGIVQDNRRQVSDFLRSGLPQFERFIDESRRLVGNLERLVARLERDPARFLLGTQNPEFRR
ncbi:MlaD family protein [Lutimaribacter marinistellae]|uniref:MlaD family protein n=1 Tax=Lutimaribacter marinistellae TaxID=1820329 RepID=A0ABV7TIH0_9RHOB